jgi:hypothetical protein
MKFHPLSNIEIDEWIRKNKLGRQYGGCVSNDTFYKIRPANRFYIYNLENSWEPGSDWQFVDFTDKNNIICFSSFGLPPNQSVMYYASKFKPQRDVYYQDKDLQTITDVNCGYWCLYMAYNIHKLKREYSDVLYNDFRFDLNGQKHNKQVLSQFFKVHPI